MPTEADSFAFSSLSILARKLSRADRSRWSILPCPKILLLMPFAVSGLLKCFSGCRPALWAAGPLTAYFSSSLKSKLNRPPNASAWSNPYCSSCIAGYFFFLPLPLPLRLRFFFPLACWISSTWTNSSSFGSISGSTFSSFKISSVSLSLKSVSSLRSLFRATWVLIAIYASLRLPWSNYCYNSVNWRAF